jgi:hypothetical protein
MLIMETDIAHLLGVRKKERRPCADTRGTGSGDDVGTYEEPEAE